MSIYIVDAGVMVKWFLPEIHTEKALRLQNPIYELHAPDFMRLEATNVLLKKVRRKELSPSDAQTILKTFTKLPISFYSWEMLLEDAWHIAQESYRSLYDTLYVALALQLKGKMVTSDRKCYDGIQNTPYRSHILWIEDIP
jgi:predicted nucleic acid-binding protein